jgi:predicted RecB family nuclease
MYAEDKPMKINNTVFLSYLRCPYKAGLLLGNQTACPTDYQILMADLAHRYKSSAQAAISRGVPDVVTSPDLAAVPSILEDGPSLILDVTIETGAFNFHFDALKRCSAARSRAPQYEPVLFHHEDTLPASQQLLLAFGGYVLERVQGHYPTAGIIVHGPQYSLRSVCLTSKYPRVELAAAALTTIATKDEQMPLLLNNYCSTCEFQSNCRAEAKKQDNLTLLNRMTGKAVKQYARKGIFTVTQLSYTFHPRRQSKRAKIHGRPHSFALQALAIRDQKIYASRDRHYRQPRPASLSIWRGFQTALLSISLGFLSSKGTASNRTHSGRTAERRRRECLNCSPRPFHNSPMATFSLRSI